MSTGEELLGELRLWPAVSIVPKGWAKCEGQLMSIPQNQALFSLLGTRFGGDGSSTFALPDLRGRALIGASLTSLPSQGEVGGTETVTLTQAQMPQHSHTMAANSGTGNSITLQDALLAGVGTSPNVGTPPPIYGPMTPVATDPRMISPSGNAQPHNNMQPSLGLYYIIATQGIYPSHN